MASSGTEAQMVRASLKSQWIRIALVVTAYWVISISMVFLNKYLLSSSDLKLDAPIFITWTQCVVSVILIAALGFLGDKYPNIDNFAPAEFKLTTALAVLPLSIVFVGMIVFNNLTLKFLGVAFYNVGRSLTTVFNVVLSYIILTQTVSMAVLGCCAVIVLGFWLGVKEEDKSVQNLSIFGVVCGVLASLCVALYSIYTKKVLPSVSDNIWRLQLYNNINAVLIMLPLIFVMGELPALRMFEHWAELYFWLLLLAAGVFGIAIGYVTSLQIKVTTPLTHNVSGTAKACAQTVLACVIYSEAKSWLWWLSNAMVLMGSAAYSYVKMNEMKVQRTLQILDDVESPVGGEKK